MLSTFLEWKSLPPIPAMLCTIFGTSLFPYSKENALLTKRFDFWQFQWIISYDIKNSSPVNIAKPKYTAAQKLLNPRIANSNICENSNYTYSWSYIRSRKGDHRSSSTTSFNPAMAQRTLRAANPEDMEALWTAQKPGAGSPALKQYPQHSVASVHALSLN